MNPFQPDQSDQRLRSLLQKAVRRGYEKLVVTVSAIMASQGTSERAWFKERTVNIAFEECWPMGAQLVFNRRFHSKAAALVKISRRSKAKDAAGLAGLSLALAGGDRSMLDGTANDRHIRILASAVRRPQDFWDWIADQSGDTDAELLKKHAVQYKNSGRPDDRAVIQTGVYLAVTASMPAIKSIQTRDDPFPYWVALDHHTRSGRRVLADVARDLHLDAKQLGWLLFYFEGACCNEKMGSQWWDRYCHWRFAKAGMAAEEAHLIWEPVRPQIMAALEQEAGQLHRDIYRWKQAHRDAVAALRGQIDAFIAHFDKLVGQQRDLF